MTAVPTKKHGCPSETAKQDGKTRRDDATSIFFRFSEPRRCRESKNIMTSKSNQEPIRITCPGHALQTTGIRPSDWSRNPVASVITVMSIAMALWFAGCNQSRYEPADWKPLTAEGTTMPGSFDGTTLPGTTLPGTTLPGRWQPGTTLPAQGYPGTTLPRAFQRGTTLPR